MISKNYEAAKHTYHDFLTLLYLIHIIDLDTFCISFGKVYILILSLH